MSNLRTIMKSDFRAIMSEHKRWLKTKDGDGLIRGQFADLRDVDLSGWDLRGVDLSYADMRRACLRGANVTGARFWDAHLSGSDLTDVTGLTMDMLAGARVMGIHVCKEIARQYGRGHDIVVSPPPVRPYRYGRRISALRVAGKKLG